MRVLIFHVIDTPGQFAGVEKIICEMTTGLESGHYDVAVAVNEGTLLDTLRQQGVRIYKIHSSKKNLLGYWLEWQKICQDFQPEVVQSHHRYTTALAHLTPVRRYKLVHTIHNEYFDKRFLHFFGDHTVAVSYHLTEYMRRHYEMNPGEIKVIYDAVRFPSVDPPLRELFPYRKKGDLAAVVVARLEEQKGHKYLIQALASLPEERNQHVKVIFVGDGSKRAELESLVKKLALKNIEFAGFQKDVYSYIRSADFTILPSLWEGLGIAILESYYYSKPVIATSIGAIKELVEDRVSGILVPPQDSAALVAAISEYLNNPQLIQNQGRAGKEIGKKFTITQMMRQYQEFYRECLTKP